jgi:hypothetical protein
MFPVNAAKPPETVRGHALKVGEMLQDCAATTPETMAPAVVVTLDSTFIRSCENSERHLEVRVGNVETKSGERQVFGSVAKTETDNKMLINRNLDGVGRNGHTALTAFTDGCPGLRRILADAGVTTAPFLDWFHIGMRLQHLKQVANGLSCDDPSRVAAKAVIVADVERPHWRLWNGKAANARISIDRIHAVMHHFKGEAGTRKPIAPSRKLWTALHALDGYLTGRSNWLVNYAERHSAGLRVGTTIAEGTANFLVNRRMNKSQQMRDVSYGLSSRERSGPGSDAARLVKRPGVLDRRRETVEHPFGTIKQWMSQGAFLMRGLEKVRAEFRLTALAHNLRRVLNLVGFTELMAAVAA